MCYTYKWLMKKNIVFIGLMFYLLLYLSGCSNQVDTIPPYDPYDWKWFPDLEIVYSSGSSATLYTSTEYKFWASIVIVNESNFQAHNIDAYFYMYDKAGDLVCLYYYTNIDFPSDFLDARDAMNCYWEGYSQDALPYSFNILLSWENDIGEGYVNCLYDEPFRVSEPEFEPILPPKGPQLEIIGPWASYSILPRDTKYFFTINFTLTNYSRTMAYELEYHFQIEDITGSLMNYWLVKYNRAESIDASEFVDHYWVGHTYNELAHHFDLTFDYQDETGTKYTLYLLNQPFEVRDYR